MKITDEEINREAYNEFPRCDSMANDMINLNNRITFKKGANWAISQQQSDMTDKKYTEEDLRNLLRARRQLYSHTDENVVKVFINSLNKQD